MIVEVFISSEWRRLTWRQGNTPVVRNEYEPSRLFHFVSPMATITAYDTNGNFRQGGSLEIQKDQEVRIFSGQGSVEIFHGVVDRDIRFNSMDETISFRAVGWLARIKRYLAGRPLNTIVGDNALDSAGVVIGSISSDDWMLRYLREFDDEDGNAKIEVVYPNTFNNVLPENRKVSLRKRHVFDSKLYDINFGTFQTENEDIFVFTGGDEDGTFTRFKTGGFFKNVPFSTIVTELVRQINIRFNEGNFALTFTQNLSLGEITGNINIRLIDNVFGAMDYFTRFINGETRMFAIGWGSSDGLPANANNPNQRLGVASGDGSGGAIGSGITLYNIINKFDPIVKNDDADFGTNWDNVIRGGFRGELPDFRNIPDPSLLSKVVISRIFPHDDENIVTIYTLWSWITIVDDSFFVDDQYAVRQRATVTWRTYNLTDGTLIGNKKAFIFDDVQTFVSSDGFIPNNFTFPTLYQSVSIDNPLGVGIGSADFSTSPPYPLSPELDSETGTHYSIDNGVPFASGNITLNSMQFNFSDTEIVEILLEICKLTNSVLYIDKDKVINIVSRDFSVNAHNLREDVVLQTTSRVTSNFGERVPNINTQIITKDSHLAVLRDFYAEQEFPKIEDRWTLRILENDTTANIKLLDTVKFPKIGFGENITPAIVRSMEFREGEINMQVTRAQ